jgi:hypothetical protein
VLATDRNAVLFFFFTAGCLRHNFHLPNKRVLSWRQFRGVWAVYNATGGTAGLERNVTTNFVKFTNKALTNTDWCHQGKMARVPYLRTFAHNYQASGQ